MDDEGLRERMSGLAPRVDTDTALAAVRERGNVERARQRALVGLGSVAAIAVLFAGLALASRRDNATEIITASDPVETVGTVAGSTTVLPTVSHLSQNGGTALAPTSAPPSSFGSASSTILPAPTVTAPPVGEFPPRDRADVSEIEIRVRPDRESIGMGERVRFDVELINHSRFTAYFSSGGCGPLHFGIEGIAEAQASPDEMTRWNGDKGTLVDHLERGNAVNNFPLAVAASVAGLPRGETCTADLRIDTLLAGKSLSRRYVWDALLPLSSSELPNSIEGVASVFLGSFDMVRESDGPVSGRAVIKLVDDPNAHRSPVDAINAVDESSIVHEWLSRHVTSEAGIGPASTTNLCAYLVSTFNPCVVTAVYARGAWEFLFRQRHTGDCCRLRVRVDPVSASILEIRAFYTWKAPSDDPDASDELKDAGTLLFPVS